MNYRKMLVLLGCVAAGMLPAHGQTWNAYNDFSATQNPTGPWSYGWSSTLSGPITVYPNKEPQFSGTVNYWVDNSIEVGSCPNVGLYSGTSGGFVSYTTGQTMLIETGPSGQFSHCTWTAPDTGIYNIQASFTALGTGGPHGYVLENGTSIGDSLLTENQPQDYTFNSLALNQGDSISMVEGVGSDNSFDDDEAGFTLTITEVSGTNGGGGNNPPPPPAPGPATAGNYIGIFNSSGVGLAGGLLKATVASSGNFTGSVEWGSKRYPLKGNFNAPYTYNAAIILAGTNQLDFSLVSHSGGLLTGTATEGGATFPLQAELVSDRGPAGGTYTFDIVPGSPSVNAPAGTGFGYMIVRQSGAATITGVLGDGTSFTSSSSITNGTHLAVYTNPYKTPDSGLSGVLVFEDLPGESDCDASLFWNRVGTGTGVYADGFSTVASFKATLVDRVIGGLNDDLVSLSATGGNLPSNLADDITIKGASTFSGKLGGVSLKLNPANDSFTGSLTENNKAYPFSGVLLPKSRTGAGKFTIGGVTGSVDISY